MLLSCFVIVLLQCLVFDVMLSNVKPDHCLLVLSRIKMMAEMSHAAKLKDDFMSMVNLKHNYTHNYQHNF